MASRKRTPRRTRTAAAGSWLALLAATTLGDGAGTLQAEVHAKDVRDGAYRLVVQSYDTAEGAVPDQDARPVGSVQRAVTAAELRSGVRVNLLELRAQAAQVAGSHPVVVAWIEAGEPDLEFDGRKARPQPGSVYGVTSRGRAEGSVHISLDRQLAA